MISSANNNKTLYHPRCQSLTNLAKLVAVQQQGVEAWEGT